LLGILCAAVEIFVLNGISIEFPGIMLGGLGYYFALTGRDELGQTLGIAAAALTAVCMGVSGLKHPIHGTSISTGSVTQNAGFAALCKP